MKDKLKRKKKDTCNSPSEYVEKEADAEIKNVFALSIFSELQIEE